MVESQLRRGGISVAPARQDTAGRCEVLGALIAGVGLRRSQAGPAGRGFHTTGADRNRVVADASGSGFGQQLPDDHFRLLVLAFAELVMPDTPLRVSEVQRGPVVIVEGKSRGIGPRPPDNR